MLLTIFTPTYNRKENLKKLYNSLCEQSVKNFEWIIVDDGSDDNTGDIVKKWIDNNIIKIRYYYQKNMGKPQAHNRGVDEANSELFVCIDSDDYIKKNAVELILNTWKEVMDDEIIGILAYRIHENGTPITKLKNKYINKFMLKEGYDKYGLSGDTMLIYKTCLLKKHKFPHFKEEKFIPEAYIYDQLDFEGKLKILREGLYVCEYLMDGYTHNIYKLLANNPKGTLVYIEQRLKIDKDLKNIILDTIRYIAISIKGKKKKIIKSAKYKIITFLMYPFGVIMYFKQYK